MSKITIHNAIKAAEHPILLETQAQLENAAERWQQSEILGIDTEFVRERTYRAALGLVQVSDGETAWLLDPLAVSSHEPLVRMFRNPGALKILHSGSEDIEVLQNAVGAIPAPLVDTQIACAMLGQSLQLGYHHALKWLFDVDIDKDQTRSNWCKRPLTDRQLLYAAMDVVLLPEMLRRLRTRLEQEGRWAWLEEDVARLRRHSLQSVDPEWVYLRFSGLDRMDSETLQALKHLARWRERVAAEKDLARGFVIKDAVLLQLARNRPSTREQVQDIRDFHPRALARYQDSILQTLADAAQDQTPVMRFEPFDGRQNQQLKQMRKMVQARAQELGVDPALLASRKELEKLIRALSAGEQPPERFRGWRKEVISDQLIAVCDS
ncbi:MAG: ribonuclease D [Xanthomonadales bacterium]|nr:ribonuclease D [Gammaproteobacteria bacterium]MBT8053636.1 ribonuclease D [Gammaproteobacteria bacterium]NND58586.1 ribonuclease D [Xanthomonadales bacterium]NNK51781.1 ribonuclease D [Xanthomonadales bacterium]